MGYGHVIEAYLKEIFSGGNSPGISSLEFFGKTVHITQEGLFWYDRKKVPEQIAIVILKYILYQGNRKAKDYEDWISFRDLKDSLPFQGAYIANVESRTERHFDGQLNLLFKASNALNGQSLNLLGFDLSYEFIALPHVYLRLLFNDREDKLPPKAKILFNKEIERYMDVECIAALAWIFVDMLLESVGFLSTFTGV